MLGWIRLAWGISLYTSSCTPSPPKLCLCFLPGTPFLHLAQNEEDGHCCLCEGDSGRGFIEIGPRPHWPASIPYPSAGAARLYSHKLLPFWSWTFQKELRGLFLSGSATSSSKCQRIRPQGAPSQAHMGHTVPLLSLPPESQASNQRMNLERSVYPLPTCRCYCLLKRRQLVLLWTGHSLGSVLDAPQVVYIYFKSQLNGLCTLAWIRDISVLSRVLRTHYGNEPGGAPKDFPGLHPALASGLLGVH